MQYAKDASLISDYIMITQDHNKCKEWGVIEIMMTEILMMMINRDPQYRDTQ